MDKKRIGINYNVSDSWIGGKYYLDGIIKVLQQSQENEIIYLKRPFILRCIGKVFGKDSFLYKNGYKKLNSKYNLDVVFPYAEHCFEAKKNICWIPDFQENYYPEFFDINEICKRLDNQARIAYSKNTLILSSNSAKNDFIRLFPKYTCNLEVLSFVSTLVNSKIEASSEDVLAKFNIDSNFFICSNQLWKHKNHIVVIKAIKELKEHGIRVLCLFTGKEKDFRNPDYPRELKDMVKTFDLEEEVRFLGFISRKDQIELMKKSIAVIQPSLFEGWNTTIEDAKFLGKQIIASNIPVQKEQLYDNGLYFDIDDYKKLADEMKKLSQEEIHAIDYHYNLQVTGYSKNINSIFIKDNE